MQNYSIHPSASQPLTEPQKRWRSWQRAVNLNLKHSFAGLEETPEAKAKRVRKRKAQKAARKVNR